VQCPKEASRRRRSLPLVQYKGTKASEYQDKALRKCCEDGMREIPMDHSCEKRSSYIQEGESCVRAFLDCCKYIEGIRQEKRRQSKIQLARRVAMRPRTRGMPTPPGEEDEVFLSDEAITSRSLFPESWLWQVEQLTEAPNELG
ncbi:complement C3-like, partial [Manacus vitellinus]|uniref:complement C3-like n=1 Tax=Manacus vitellinus TaxID=328815 RepID=UPI00115EEBB8